MRAVPTAAPWAQTTWPVLLQPTAGQEVCGHGVADSAAGVPAGTDHLACALREDRRPGGLRPRRKPRTRPLLSAAASPPPPGSPGTAVVDPTRRPAGYGRRCRPS